MTSAGQQLDGKMLYERQKAMREANTSKVGPSIIAVDMHTPENIGSVLRLADAAGCRRVVFVGTDDIDQSRVHKTARNCETSVQWSTMTHDAFRKNISEYEPLIALEITSESASIFDARLPDECAIVIGSERHGVPEAMLSLCKQAVHIPMFGVNGSMNVTHALAVAVFEWRRQHVRQLSPS